MAGLSLLLVLALTATPQSAGTVTAPHAGEFQEIVLLDGTHATGRVEQVTDTMVTFRTTSGALLEVERAKIASLAGLAGRVVDRSFWRADPNPTRLLFGPTGRSLKRGEAYLAVYEVSMPFVQVGLTDRISIGGGTLPFVGGGAPHPFWLSPKAQLFAGARTQAAVGLLHIANLGGAGAGLAYGVVTHGTADAAMTAGLGYGYVRGQDSSGGAPVVMVGGERRVARRMKLVTENYLFRGGGLLGGGVRMLGERLSVDFAMAAPLTTEGFVAFPVVNFVWTFR